MPNVLQVKYLKSSQSPPRLSAILPSLIDEIATLLSHTNDAVALSFSDYVITDKAAILLASSQALSRLTSLKEIHLPLSRMTSEGIAALLFSPWLAAAKIVIRGRPSSRCPAMTEELARWADLRNSYAAYQVPISLSSILGLPRSLFKERSSIRAKAVLFCAAHTVLLCSDLEAQSAVASVLRAELPLDELLPHEIHFVTELQSRVWKQEEAAAPKASESGNQDDCWKDGPAW